MILNKIILFKQNNININDKNKPSLYTQVRVRFELKITFTYINPSYISGWVSGSCDVSPR